MQSYLPTVVNHCGFDFELHLLDRVPHYILRATGEKPTRVEVTRVGPRLWQYPVYSSEGYLMKWKVEDQEVASFLEDELEQRAGELILA